MENYYANHPTLEYFNEISKRLPFHSLLENSFHYDEKTKHSNWVLNHEIDDWKELFSSRIGHTYRSLVYLNFYKSLGINDDNWIKKDNGRVEKFPDFNLSDWIHKDLFDYYVDAFLNKGFSSLEILGHIIYKRYRCLTTKRISFYTVVESLKETETDLYYELNMVCNSVNYKEGKRLRNEFTHNFPSSETSSFANSDENYTEEFEGISYRSIASIGFNNVKYTPSVEIIEICENFWSSLLEIIKIINLIETTD